MDETSLTPEVLVSEIRFLLEQEGEVGTWLLARIDDVLASGVEIEEALEGSDQRVTLVRSPAPGWEVLSIHLKVLKAYLVELPACVSATQESLRRDFGVSEARFSFRSDIAANDIFIDERVEY